MLKMPINDDFIEIFEKINSVPNLILIVIEYIITIRSKVSKYISCFIKNSKLFNLDKRAVSGHIKKVTKAIRSA